MTFEFLKFAVGVFKRIFIIKPGQQTKRDLIILHAIDKAAAISLIVMGVTHGVDDFSGSDSSFRNLPDLFDAHHIALGVSIAVQFIFFDKGFGEASPRPFPKYGHLGL